jgi:phage-related minor tail protein
VAEIAVLRVKIDPSGATTGSREVVVSLDKINSAAGRVGGAVDKSGAVLGGFGLRASAVGAVIGGVTTTLTAFGAGIAAAIAEAADAQPRLAQLNATIASTGGVAGVTSAQAVALANSIEDLTAVDDDLVISAESILLTFTNISGAVFPRAVQAATDLSAKFGTDLNSAIKMVGRALDDPVHGLTLLTRAGVSFTAQQKDQIKALVESGQAMKAQEIVLGALETKVGGAGAAFRDTFQGSQEAGRQSPRVWLRLLMRRKKNTIARMRMSFRRKFSPLFAAFPEL